MKNFQKTIRGILLTCACCICFGAIAQTENQIEVRDEGGLRFYVDDVKLSKSEVGSQLKSNAEAYQLYRSGRTNRGVGTFFAAGGCFLIGYGAGSALREREVGVDWTLIGVGGGGTVLGIVLGIVGDDKIKAAIELYNNDLASTDSKANSIRLVLGSSPHGMGLQLHF